MGDKKLTEAKQAENWQTGKSPRRSRRRSAEVRQDPPEEELMRSDTDLVIREVATVFSPDTGPCEHDVTVLVSPGFTEASFGDAWC